MNKKNNHTHFGYRNVSYAQKTQLVGEVFRRVANNYDVMNDLMSIGVHRLWKRFAVARCGVRAGHKVLDVASGTGDLAALLAREVGVHGLVVMSDLSAPMLSRGRDKILDRGHAANVYYVRADAECLPFPVCTFDCISIGFGLRNVTHIERALVAMHAALVPGGRLVVLEFSKPAPFIARLYDQYSSAIIPRLGAMVTGDGASYRYLVESIRRHPDQDTLKKMMHTAGFDRVEYFNLAAGIVAVHVAYKY